MLETNNSIHSLKNTSLPTFQATPGTCMLHYLDQRANFPLDTVLESSDLCKNCAQATYVTTSSMMLFGLLRRKRKKTVNQKQQLHKLWRNFCFNGKLHYLDDCSETSSADQCVAKKSYLMKGCKNMYAIS